MFPAAKRPEVRIFITPDATRRCAGNWNVMGLRATGSVDYTIDGVYVPDEYTHWQGANTPNQGGLIFTLAIYGISAIGHSGFALGIGRRVLDELRTLAMRKADARRRCRARRRRKFPGAVRQAEAKYRSCRALIHECWADIEGAWSAATAPARARLPSRGLR